MLRTCMACGQTDDHPRHSLIIRLQPELVEEEMHKDCCVRERGCRQCWSEISGADGKTGDELRAHITAHHAVLQGAQQ